MRKRLLDAEKPPKVAIIAMARRQSSTQSAVRVSYGNPETLEQVHGR
jgi:hypothetical protein